MYQRRIPYHKIVAAKLQRNKERRSATHADRYMKIDKFMLAYEQAFLDYFGIPITIHYHLGWYYVSGRRYRHSDVERMTGILLAKVQEEQSPEGDDECVTQSYE